MTDQNDPLYDQAVAFAREREKFTRVGLCGALEIGYNRACRLVEAMETAGVVWQNITEFGTEWRVTQERT
jgi:S-DNA-T family DNA segregation ATPase FtsK/SpoIIIE